MWLKSRELPGTIDNTCLPSLADTELSTQHPSSAQYRIFKFALNPNRNVTNLHTPGVCHVCEKFLLPRIIRPDSEPVEDKLEQAPASTFQVPVYHFG
ncbi:hypothetical protein MPER_06830 [Moniliophthora perniciosa FA553]|nr:hypothetical protein MPER_06830 [Moniliophthora perniciosa FA553]